MYLLSPKADDCGINVCFSGNDDDPQQNGSQNGRSDIGSGQIQFGINAVFAFACIVSG